MSHHEWSPLKNGPPGPNIAAICGPPCHRWSHPWHGFQQVSRLTSGPGKMKLSMQSVLGWVFKARYLAYFKLWTPVTLPSATLSAGIEWSLYHGRRMAESHWWRMFTVPYMVLEGPPTVPWMVQGNRFLGVPLIVCVLPYMRTSLA